MGALDNNSYHLSERIKVRRGFAQKVRNPTDAVGGYFILDLPRLALSRRQNSTDAVGELFIPTSKTQILFRKVSVIGNRFVLIRQCMNNPPTASVGFLAMSSMNP